MILNMLHDSGKVMIAPLVEAFGVSDVSIRKDLAVLEERQLLVRVKGGAIVLRPGGEKEDISISRKQKLHAREKEMLGRYVSDHPLSPYVHALADVASCSILDISDKPDGFKGTFAGVISQVAIRQSKNGNNYAQFQLEDTEGEIQVNLFGKSFNSYRHLLEEDAIVKVEGAIEKNDRGVSMRVFKMEGLAFTEEDTKARVFEIRLSSDQLDPVLMSHISDTLQRYPGRDAVSLRIDQRDGRVFRAELPTTTNAKSPGLFAEITDMLGSLSCEAVRR